MLRFLPVGLLDLALVSSTFFPLFFSSIVELDKMFLLENVSLILNLMGTAAMPLAVKSVVVDLMLF